MAARVGHLETMPAAGAGEHRKGKTMAACTIEHGYGGNNKYVVRGVPDREYYSCDGHKWQQEGSVAAQRIAERRAAELRGQGEDAVVRELR